MATDDAIPPGWDYNPSTVKQRLPIIALALLGVAVAGYLALYQFGVIRSIWDPLFGDGTVKVLESELSRDLSRWLLLPDAAVGALSYLLDAVTGAIGGRRRWQRMPWLVILFGLAVGPLGIVSVALVASQPVVVGAWCFLCLASALLSLAMIGPAMDEVLASLQHLKREASQGRSAWRAFWGLA